ncbi:MAG: RdgB/HAM1 family non-canonical purine NTP pyrophosphatase [Saprospiraceae bacterium]
MNLNPMEPLIFATRNANKVRELNAQIDGKIEIKTLDFLNHMDELPEDFRTLEENARQKAEFIHKLYAVNCFSEDTGLEIEALDGKPGVDTAHYSGSRDNDSNIAKVLSEMSDLENRTARFRTVIYLILDGDTHIFEGIVTGKIAQKASIGKEGFGYDPIFIPDGYKQSFAEMPLELKKEISHRAKAVEKLVSFLREKL